MLSPGSKVLPNSGFYQTYSDHSTPRGQTMYGSLSPVSSFQVQDSNSYNKYNIPNQYSTQKPEEGESYCDMQLDPEISRILAHSRIERELVYVWKSFREKTGPKLKNRFMRYVQLANQAARLNGKKSNIFIVLY